MVDHLIALLPFAWLLWIVLVALGLILERRSPAATLAWLLALLFMPYFGFLVYLLFGPRRLRRRRLRYGRARERLIQSTRDLRPDHAIPEGFPDAGLERQIALLLARISQGAPAPATGVTVLETGDACYEAIETAIAAAQHHIHLEYYMWQPDQVGTRLRDALIEKARHGVQVRLLLDAIGSDRINHRFLQPLQDAGVQVAWFNPIGLRRFRLKYVNFRTHRKIMVCDGRVGFTGGINISDEHSQILCRNDAWRDTHLRIEGEPVHRLQFIFLEDWYFATDQAPFEDKFFPRFAETTGHWLQIVESGPDNNRHAIAKLYFAAIAGAQRQLLLATPYFVPSEALTTALVTAALRGVNVQVLAPKNSDSRLVTAAARSYYDELVSAGVAIHEYGPPMLHAKLMVVDERIAAVGSANFDNRSLMLNFEAIAVLYDAGLAATLAHSFAADLRCASRYVKPGRRATLSQRLGESTARLLSPLL
ncbi:MAG: cardiolipin synthase [Candidatus Competibacteraceae bacterium]|nr:cardiolipin synthase [Candidatus Competibacteraceae bacterium]MCP5125205.1 cardiolipin synthase [Gammaproteobacteria bacterium]HRX71779.1 cardiolipin synthase [Candidatus Competibacteraceae bacterium]